MNTGDNATQAGRAARPDFIKVWDPVVRMLHWVLVLVFALAWLTADEWDIVHEYAGYAVAILVGMRIVWGVIGTRHARFSDFIYRPSAVIAYLKDSIYFRAKRYIGHNPAGGAMVLALLVSLLIATATGVLSIMEAYRQVEWIEDLHEVTANLTALLIILHIAGVILTGFKHRENLVKAMFTGLKRPEE